MLNIAIDSRCTYNNIRNLLLTNTRSQNLTEDFLRHCNLSEKDDEDTIIRKLKFSLNRASGVLIDWYARDLHVLSETDKFLFAYQMLQAFTGPYTMIEMINCIKSGTGLVMDYYGGYEWSFKVRKTVKLKEPQPAPINRDYQRMVDSANKYETVDLHELLISNISKFRYDTKLFHRLSNILTDLDGTLDYRNAIDIWLRKLINHKDTIFFKSKCCYYIYNPVLKKVACVSSSSFTMKGAHMYRDPMEVCCEEV